MTCFPDEDKECVEEARSVSDGRFMGEGDEEGIVLQMSKAADDKIV